MDPIDLTIRKATADDAAAAWGIRTAVIRHACKGFYADDLVEQWTAGEMTGQFVEAVVRQFYVATASGVVAGTGLIDLGDGRLDAVFVRPDMMGKGIGKRIVTFLQDVGRSAGFTKLKLDSTLNAAPFYRRCGFVGDVIGVYRSPRGISLDCVPMTKRIAPRPLVVREVRPDDTEAILRILNPIIESGAYSALDTPFTVVDEREFIRGFPQRGVFHVAEESGERRVVGFQTLEPFATYTRAFDHVGVVATFAEMAYRGRGVGKRLAEASFEQARRRGYEKLFTFVRADNPDALRFYRGLGFRVIGTAARQAKIRGKYVDEVIIERFL